VPCLATGDPLGWHVAKPVATWSCCKLYLEWNPKGDQVTAMCKPRPRHHPNGRTIVAATESLPSNSNT